MRLAFLADIHGNLPALEAVLADLRGQAPDRVYLLGDLVNRCPWNNEVMDILGERGWPSIQGNHDLVVSRINTPESRAPFTDRQRFPVIYWTWEQLRGDHIQTLHDLPEELGIAIDGAPRLRLFHGAPGDPFAGIAPEAGDDAIDALVAPYREPVIVCGHTHRPLDRQVNGHRVLNPGSVGLPYNRDPRAQYMLLDLVRENGARRWQPTFRRLEYDRSVVPDAFARSGMLEAGGPLVRLYLRTVLNGEPWASDFGHWLKSQPDRLRRDLATAVDVYLRAHGPDHWAFTG